MTARAACALGTHAPEAAGTPLRLLLDTNVWVDYFLARGQRGRDAAALVTASYGRDDVALYVSALSVKDVYYLLQAALKAQLRAEGREVTPSDAAAAREVAWGCVRRVLELALVVGTTRTEVLRAVSYRRLHDDLEDDLLLSAATTCDADYVVTSDEALGRHVAGSTLIPAEAAGLVAGCEGQGGA